MAHHVGIGQDIDQGQHRCEIHSIDQEFRPKVHASINPSARASYVGV